MMKSRMEAAAKSTPPPSRTVTSEEVDMGIIGSSSGADRTLSNQLSSENLLSFLCCLVAKKVFSLIMPIDVAA
jgi:hypothetical protein